ncbi:TonB-dependent receptor [Escherichia albertii]
MEKVPFKSKHWLQIAPFLLCTQAIAEPVTSKADTDNDVIVMDTVDVDDTHEGSAEDGYRITNVSGVGPFAKMKLQDTPYSINVISQDMLNNVQATMPVDAFKYNPYTQVYIQSGRLADNINMRGFYNTLRTQDGIRVTGAETLEDKERVEVMTGASGFMYGIGSPAGVVNYVTKRPTYSPMANIKLGNTGGNSYYLHGDFGNALNDDGTLAYRLNIMGQEGDTFVDYQTVHKYLLSGALDWHLTDSLLLQFDASSYYNKTDGMQIAFAPVSGQSLNSLDLSKINTYNLYGQKWGYQRDQVDQIGSRLIWDINPDLKLRSAVRYSVYESERLNVNSKNITSFDAPYQESLYHISAAPTHTINIYNYLDWQFSTSSIDHLLTAGVFWDSIKSKASPDRTASVDIPGTFYFSNPQYVDKPDYEVGEKSKVNYTDNEYISFILSDNIKFNEQWSVLAGVNFTRDEFKTYNLNNGDIASNYDKTRPTPTLALMYKPIPIVTTYISYVEAIEQGGFAPDLYNGHDVTNAGEMMAPMVTRQYELGSKMTIDDMLLTAAFFYIDKANQYVDPDSYTYVQDGREVHQGVEFTATGKITPRLTVTGGLTFMNAKIKDNSASPQLEGKHPTSVPDQMGKLLLEYELPWINGLTLTGGAFYTGKMWNDANNTDQIPSATTFDIGARYQTVLSNTPLTFRLNVNNLTDKRYWLPYGYVSDPRYVTFSAEVDF